MCSVCVRGWVGGHMYVYGCVQHAGSIAKWVEHYPVNLLEFPSCKIKSLAIVQLLNGALCVGQCLKQPLSNVFILA